jgi:hypothetical protein
MSLLDTPLEPLPKLCIAFPNMSSGINTLEYLQYSHLISCCHVVRIPLEFFFFHFISYSSSAIRIRLRPLACSHQN